MTGLLSLSKKSAIRQTFSYKDDKIGNKGERYVGAREKRARGHRNGGYGKSCADGTSFGKWMRRWILRGCMKLRSRCTARMKGGGVSIR